ncbi:MAG: hypothetical protein QNJ90_10670 [Planctomycetota bacterium]|nr:hypothetical protein [Planctomycetota bacterium]
MREADLDLLRKYAGRYRKVRLTRPLLAGQHTHGFVLALSDELVLMSQFHDFYSEGAVVLRLKDISGLRSGEFERCFEKMYRAEGLLDAVGLSVMPPLDDMRTLTRWLRDTRTPAIIEQEVFEGGDEEDELFLLGYVTDVGEGDVWIRHFDATGVWEEEDDFIELDAITSVQLEAPYLETWLRHIPPCPAL